MPGGIAGFDLAAVSASSRMGNGSKANGLRTILVSRAREPSRLLMEPRTISPEHPLSYDRIPPHLPDVLVVASFRFGSDSGTNV